MFKLFQNWPFFSHVLGQQTRVSNFNKIRLQEKFLSGKKCSEIFGNFQGKEYVEITRKVAPLEISIICLLFGVASLQVATYIQKFFHVLLLIVF